MILDEWELMVVSAIVLFELEEESHEGAQERKRRLKRERRRKLQQEGRLSTKKQCIRSDIVPPAMSSWSHFLVNGSGREESWVHMFGMPPAAFQELV